MLRSNRWAVLFAVLLMMAGQTTHACDMMDMPAQPECCCDEGMTRSDITESSDEDCDHDHAKESCCSVEYHSPAKGAIAASLFPDKPPTSLSVVALAPGPSLEALLSPPKVRRLSQTSSSLLLAKAATGRIVYLSTRRLRI